MAKADPSPTPVFMRGSAVLEYWLAHPEGLTVQPLNARVERAVGSVPLRPAAALVVRAPNGRQHRIASESVVAVDPGRQELILAGSGGSDPIHEHVARAARGGARAAIAIATWAWLAARWLAPRLRSAAVATGRATWAAARWLAPRAVAAGRSAARLAAQEYRSLSERRTSSADMSGDSPRTTP